MQTIQVFTSLCGPLRSDYITQLFVGTHVHFYVEFYKLAHWKENVADPCPGEGNVPQTLCLRPPTAA